MKRWVPLVVGALMVPASVTENVVITRVIVDPVWAPPSDGGPRVDVLVV